MEASALRTGQYRHFKGGLYHVVGTALSSETQETMVIYTSSYHGTTWVRPLKMFIEDVPDPKDETGKTKVPRFLFIGPPTSTGAVPR